MPSFLDNLNTMNAGITRFTATLEGVVNETKTLGKTLEEIARTTSSIGNQTVLVKAFQMVNQALAVGKESLDERTNALKAQVKALDDQKTALGRRFNAAAKEYYDKSIARLENEAIKIGFLRELREKMGERAIYWGSRLYVLYKGTFESLRQMNEQLKEAAMTDGDRFKTNLAIFQTTRSLGAPLASSMEAAKELARYGMEFYGDMQDNLETVTMMKDGLGVSAESAAELSAIVTRSLKVGFRDVADAIANTARDTGLSAQLATKFATQIARAAMIFRDGITKEMPKVIGYVTRLEGLLQEVGGVAGGITDLITRLTTVEGMVGAAMLGVSSPEFMATEAGAKQVMGGFADFAKNFLGDAAGWERTLRIQMLADMYGTTAQQVSGIVRAVELENKRLATQSGLEKTYRDQMAATGEGWNRLKNSLMAMLQEGLAPVLWVLNKVVNALATFVGWLQKHAKWVSVIVIGAAALVATGWVAYRAVMGLAAACAWLSATASGAARSVAERGIVDTVTGGRGRGLGRMLGRARQLGARGINIIVRNNFKTLAMALVRGMLAFLGKAVWAIGSILSAPAFLAGLAIAAAAAVGVGLGFLTRKLFPVVDTFAQYMMGVKQTYKTAHYTKTNEEWMKAYVAKMAGEGMDTEAMTKVLRLRMQGENLAPDVEAAKIGNLMRWAQEQVGDIRYQEFMGGHSLIAQDKGQQTRLLEDQKKLTEETVKHTELAKKQIETAKRVEDAYQKERDSHGWLYNLWFYPQRHWLPGSESPNKR